ncbi:MAG: GNAT family N-acetyltransferase [Bacilli bacterium]|nr:GNAT family N-acetyltransferase [Bacilli bacterium]
MDLFIRKYEDKDYETVNKILNINFSHGMVDKEIPSNVERYVCDSSDGVVGFFVLTKMRNIIRGFDYYIVDYVCSSVHGKGIGSFMTKYLCDKCDNEDVKYIQLSSSRGREDARRLYQKFGFEIRDSDIFRRYKK